MFAVCVTGFSDLCISRGRSVLAKLFNVIYLEGLRELQCIFHFLLQWDDDTFCIVAAFRSGFRWANEEYFLQLKETIDCADGM